MDEDIVAILAGTVMVSIPLLAVSARIALKPMVEAIVRLRGGETSESRALQARRIADLEEEVDDMRRDMQELQQTHRFDAQLGAGSAARAVAPAPTDG